MTIKEAKELKKQTEESIAKLVGSYMELTGLGVESIGIDFVDRNIADENKARVIGIFTEITIETKL